ncbi:hypothetical protein [Hymenobacter canadensis]|uniref:Uncharacterized protein n=1 Tax=Hymenobacter canadensis TaxID=2999067 RepID=A0ABY7LS22_9BACT|nr:hypothetical protein [Hymenobacter canadensis]WBA42256.1 hypothetical protein O3303_01565 [Hymenobacter canadensis]
MKSVYPFLLRHVYQLPACGQTLGLLLITGLALSACSVSSHNQLSPDREPAAPRYVAPADTSRMDSMPLPAPL